MKKLKALTKAEESVMRALWKLDGSHQLEIMETISLPKPSYRTLGIILRDLVSREYVKYNELGNCRHKPIISQTEYEENGPPF